MKPWLSLLLLLLPFFAAGEARLVTIGGDVTEIVYALKADRQLVGRDSTSTAPEAATRLPDVGYMRQLNAEGILSLRPTLVVASAQAQPSLVLRQLTQSGVKVVTVPGDNSLAAIRDKITVVAGALNARAAGKELVAQMDSALAQLPARPLDKKVLFIMSHGGMTAMGAGQQTAADAAIQAAGLRNAMQGFSRYQPLSQEGVIASAPDLIVMGRDSVQALGGASRVWALPGLAQTPAGAQHRLLLVDDMALLGFSLRTPGAILALRQAADQLP